MKKIISVLSMIAMLSGAVLMFGACATTQGVPSAQPMPEGISFTGLWYSEQFEHMYLYQDGDQVEGVYAYGGGGTITGEVDGNRLLFGWEDPGNRDEVRRTMKGKGYLQIVEESDQFRLKGEWGYNQERRGAGPWTAEFIRGIEDDDPTTLEAIRRIH